MMGFRDSTLKYFKDILRQRFVREVIAVELRDAHMRLLEAETASELAQAHIQYNTSRIKRLEQRLHQHTLEGDYV
jgi:hypothetical protein